MPTAVSKESVVIGVMSDLRILEAGNEFLVPVVRTSVLGMLGTAVSSFGKRLTSMGCVQ